MARDSSVACPALKSALPRLTQQAVAVAVFVAVKVAVEVAVAVEVFVGVELGVETGKVPVGVMVAEAVAVFVVVTVGVEAAAAGVGVLVGGVGPAGELLLPQACMKTAALRMTNDCANPILNVPFMGRLLIDQKIHQSHQESGLERSTMDLWLFLSSRAALPFLPPGNLHRYLLPTTCRIATLR